MAIWHAAPERYVVLTDVGDRWDTVRARMRRLRYDLVQELGAVEWVWTVERNPKGTGHHINAYQRGEFLPQARLSEMAQRRGMGKIVDIRRWRSGGEGYALKEAYSLKDAQHASIYLTNNGGRLTHQSRGFFPLGVREHERLGIKTRRGDDGRTWRVASVADLAAAGE